MALAKEIMGIPLISEKSSFASSSPVSYFSVKRSQIPFLIRPFDRKPVFRFPAKRSSGGVVAAISEDLVKMLRTTNGDGKGGRSEEEAVKFKVRAVVTVRNNKKEDFKETLVKHLDCLADRMGRNVVLELISTELDPKTNEAKKSREAVLEDWSKKSRTKAERVHYTAVFTVDAAFGTPGAITVMNRHRKEFFLESITVEGFACGPVHFPCNSWVQSQKIHPQKRIFFSNQPYLPRETPAGLRALRENELRNLRGDGKGERRLSDRIYDYDVYNDLGNPDNGLEFVRPTLGGQEIPYPRRCRTGRPPTDNDRKAESRVEKPLPMYVPRDERFEEAKNDTFEDKRFKAVLHNLIPSLKASLIAQDFASFSEVDSLYKEDTPLLKNLPLPEIVDKLQESSLRYDSPIILSKDKFAWLRDDEFGRQAVAGINPVSIERVKRFPPVSELDPEIYGPQRSALTHDHIIGHIDGMSVQQAVEENRLYMLDYHDIYLPFLDRINALDGRKAYATRTIFFLTSLGTLKPIAIELTLPPSGSSHRSKRVVTPAVDATTNWTWQLAKAHVCSNDAGVHQLVNHFLRTHACLEPFILAAHRQLSSMHPIFKLLDPHMRYTLEINALARQSLINADGVIEAGFTPGQYCMEISSSAYKNLWRFDMEGLPADLVRRGIAVPDPTQPHGLKLLIEDYPYANDGLLIWSAIQTWVRTYVDRYYPDRRLIRTDHELQSWYTESINVGHADIAAAEWWPELSTAEDLVSVITTLIWLASAQHAALNFAQYPYGGYVPIRPPLMRRLIPDESDPEFASFMSDPHKYILLAMPSVRQATQFMAVVDTLSTHSPDEEYIGERNQPSIWTGDREMVDAFYKFAAEIGRLEKEIEKRNKDPSRRNRCGVGVLPYELLAPSSEPGVTCRGVPNSVTT
ncbi:PREDICTED: lipoxygenase 3, chloroplastic-like [Tarenaya hassleriana]|uniref:lipoxygenase 3, chloroplastic-like n=1 Tax=Tarenaya hassleriana TaxID=28532 RepID=UPI00053C1D0D|nr:PREDICTED: lipoxygenase 3, chloroplastic-like [Tarenaya hassleriana]